MIVPHNRVRGQPDVYGLEIMPLPDGHFAERNDLAKNKAAYRQCAEDSQQPFLALSGISVDPPIHFFSDPVLPANDPGSDLTGQLVTGRVGLWCFPF